jgi:putative holliday junction resolvase
VRHSNPREFIGVDVGTVRVGLARGSDIARIAQPRKTAEAKEAINEIKVLIDTRQIAGLVVGLPRGLDGQDTRQTASVIEWVEKAKNDISLPFYWQDEALSTHSAEQSRIDPKIGADAYAAAVILQDFLDTPEAERVRC